jgi:hypothetical protein
MRDKLDSFVPLLSGDTGAQGDTQAGHLRGEPAAHSSAERDDGRDTKTLEQRLLELLRWAEQHTELGNALLKEHAIAPQDALRERFIASLKDGVELLDRSIKNEPSVGRHLGRVRPSVASGPGVPVSAECRDAVLPLSGSRRFGDLAFSRTRAVEDLPSVRRSGLASCSPTPARERLPQGHGFSPSRSYCKKKG